MGPSARLRGTMRAAPLPVTVIGGYLGAGKTTLVNALLRRANGTRLAVLVNDFGALPIDADLILSPQGDPGSSDGDTLAIAGGCVCCSFGSELIETMQALEKRAPRPDHVLVEASGVALPGGIAATVSLLSGYVVDGVVVLADAETVRARATDRYLGDTIERQLADADLVLATKTDLVDDASRTETPDWLGARGRTLDVRRGDVPFELLTGLRTDAPRAKGFSPAPHADYESRAFDALGALDVERLATGLADPALGVLRAKGLLERADGTVAELHVVGRRADVRDAASRATPGRLVCIGLRGRLNAARIRTLIESLTCETTP